MSSMTTKEFANNLRGSIEVNRYASLCASIGASLNGRKDRFDKSDLIEISVEVFSNSRLKWIDEEGRDHFDTSLKKFIELKFLEDGILTNKEKRRRKNTEVVIKNLRTIPETIDILEHKRSNYYIIAQQDAMIVLSWEEIKPLLRFKGTKITAVIPSHIGHFIFTPRDVTNISINKIDYRKAKIKMIRSLVNQF